MMSLGTLAGPARPGASGHRENMPHLRAAVLVHAALSCAAPASSLFPPATPPDEPRGMIRFPLAPQTDALAVCNDGTPAAMYWRNCTANEDRAPGDKGDYCAKGNGKDGVDQNIWFIAFEQAGFCYDSASCAARKRATPQRMTSSSLPSSVFPSGALSCYPEENPNYYKSTTVFVPSCSSDEWLGDSGAGAGAARAEPQFRGARILQAVFLRLAGALASERGGADVIVISGGAGVMAALRTPEVRALLPPTAAVRAVCDGCLLSASAPLVPVAAQPCSTDADCPPAVALAKAVPYWNATATLGESCAAGRCLLAPSLLPQLARPPAPLRRSPAEPAAAAAAAAVAVPTALIYQNLYDVQTLRALRAWPAAHPGSAAHTFALAHAATVRQSLLRTGSSLIIAPACTGHLNTSAMGAFFIFEMMSLP